MEKMKMETPDLIQQNIEKIAALFPSAITETRGEDGSLRRAVNFDMLRQLLTDEVLADDEGFEFTWSGKKAAIVEASKPCRKTLRPYPEESKNWDNTKNLYIEGDNLEVLKLLHESYLGKVKMIYIDKGYACSAAQMFLDSGDGVVFRGNIGPWLSKDEKTFHLNHDSAKKLLTIAIDSYRQKHKQYPKELFIHGKTAFSDDEWQGFQDAIAASSSTNIVGITIKGGNTFRLLKDNNDSKSQYGIMRGLCLYVNEKSGYLWTKGFIPKTETANHLEVACPLYIEINRGNSDIHVVMKDILALTKLNYNACIYGDGIPVTLRFSDRIGNILTAIPEVNWAAKPFKYYI